MPKLTKKHALKLFPSFMQPSLIKLYSCSQQYWIKLHEIYRALYIRYTFMQYSNGTKKELDNILRYLDHWVLAHSAKQNSNGYVPEDFFPPIIDVSAYHGIQQVRAEICEFVRILLAKGLSGNVLEIGLGYYGGTHMLWRQIFNRVITVEFNAWSMQRFRLSERLDPRSTIIIGNSHEPQTLEKVRSYVNSVDLLFIDGDHEYESVAKDWAMYHSLVKPGGIIAFHDSVCKAQHFGIFQFLYDLSNGNIDNKHHILHNIVYSENVGISYEEIGK